MRGSWGDHKKSLKSAQTTSPIGASRRSKGDRVKIKYKQRDNMRGSWGDHEKSLKSAQTTKTTFLPKDGNMLGAARCGMFNVDTY